jgi:hypothetical protein
VILLKQTETLPESYPTVTGLSAAAAALAPEVIWQRIENWIAYRWPERTVVWEVEGSGLFMPPLAQWQATKLEKAGETWNEIPLTVSAIGVHLDGGYYRVTAQVGSENAPAAVVEAYRRLAEYLVQVDEVPAGVTRWSESLGPWSTSVSRVANAKAKALQLSGAADLLRPWRSP